MNQKEIMTARSDNAIEPLHRKLDQFRLLLANDSLLSLTTEQQHSLREEAEKISQKLRSLQESFLTIGLLGGTGERNDTTAPARQTGSFPHDGVHRTDTGETHATSLRERLRAWMCAG